MIVRGCGQENYQSLLNIDDARFDAILEWIEACRSMQVMQVTPMPLDSLTQWNYSEETGDLQSNTGGFFSISGISAKRQRDEFRWSQPIIVQPEVGILGILTRNIDGCRHFLMQAKIEPGNIGGVQISPTIQATWSNYTGVHKGRSPDYLEHFLEYDEDKLLSRQLLSEQGARFFQKKNLNIIIELDDDVEVKENFFWMTLGDIKRLLSRDNLINMDSRTVFSTLDYSGVDNFQGDPGSLAAAYFRSCDIDIALYEPDCLSWWKSQDFGQLAVDRVNLDKVTGWELDSRGYLSHLERDYFSVIGVSVTARGREVDAWDQPLLSSNGHPGLIGCLITIRDGILLFLLKAKAEVGTQNILELSPTLSLSNYQVDDRISLEKYSSYFTADSPGQVIYDGMQSEEGGRFYHMENRNLVVYVDNFDEDTLPDYFRWFTLSEISFMQDSGLVNIDLRTLLACFPLDASL